MTTLTRIAVLTSGGDAAGMNSAIRAVARTGLSIGAEVIGVRDGFEGLIAGDFVTLSARRVGGVLQHGGTFLGSARSEEFRTEDGRQKAREQLRKREVQHLVVIGGNGSIAGGYALATSGLNVMGIPATIDNDVYGTEMAIGVDTALNIALEAIDRIRTTASSHQSGFLVEVMGRDSGYLALTAGLAGGAEAIVIPEVPIEPEQVAARIREAYERKKKHAIVVVAEGSVCNSERMMAYFRHAPEDAGFTMRTTILGHVQRGGVPTAQDRLLGARFGADVVARIAAGERNQMVGMRNGALVAVPIAQVATGVATLDTSMLELARSLAR